MKLCPQCGREYDNTIMFCLDDGAELLYGPASTDDPPTAIMSGPPASAGGQDMREGKTAILGATEPDDAASEAFRPVVDGSSFSNIVQESTAPVASVAVLPFAHLSPDPDDEYFCDGLAEELINALARVDGLKVVARTSAFSFKGKNVSVSDIGSMLKVQNVVEGSVRRSGNRMRITVQLINAADGYHLWSDKYDTKMRDLFDVQDGISRSVVTALKSRLLDKPQESEQIAELIDDLKHRAYDVGAYELYLRGKFFWNKFTVDDFYRAVDCFNKAIEIDPNFAPAYAGLADCHVMLTEWGPVPSIEGLPKAKEAALKAISLDPNRSEAHASLGLVLQEFDFDFEQAAGEYQQALELNPNNVTAHQYYGVLHAQMGRHDEAEVECLKALELDPLSAVSTWAYSFVLYLARRFDESIEQANRVLELDRNFSAAYLVLSVVLQLRSDFSGSVNAFTCFLELSGMTEIASKVQQLFDTGGWNGFLRSMTSESNRAQLPGYMTAAHYVALGDHDAAFSSLNDSYAQREGFIVMLKTDPRFIVLRPDPRFQALLKKVGFPE